MDNLVTTKNRRYGMRVSTHPKQCSSSAASHCNQCTRYRSTKNDHDSGTPTHIHNFKRTSHLTNVLFVPFEGTNLWSKVLKLYLGSFFLKIMSKSLEKSNYAQPRHKKFGGFVRFLCIWWTGT